MSIFQLYVFLSYLIANDQRNILLPGFLLQVKQFSSSRATAWGVGTFWLGEEILVAKQHLWSPESIYGVKPDKILNFVW